MKTLSSVLLVVLTAAFAHAGTPLPVTDVPEKVLSTLREYFPGATPLAAEKDVQANRTKYEVLVQYKCLSINKLLAIFQPQAKIRLKPSNNGGLNGTHQNLGNFGCILGDR